MDNLEISTTKVLIHGIVHINTNSNKLALLRQDSIAIVRVDVRTAILVLYTKIIIEFASKIYVCSILHLL